VANKCTRLGIMGWGFCMQNMPDKRRAPGRWRHGARTSALIMRGPGASRQLCSHPASHIPGGARRCVCPTLRGAHGRGRRGGGQVRMPPPGPGHCPLRCPGGGTHCGPPPLPQGLCADVPHPMPAVLAGCAMTNEWRSERGLFGHAKQTRKVFSPWLLRAYSYHSSPGFQV
jgi:hypothetical protein